MIFEEYCKKLKKLKKEKNKLNKLENKKISLMGMVDVKAIAPKNSIGGNALEDKMMKYASELEELEMKISKCKKILLEIQNQLEIKENELRESSELLDLVYLYKYIDKLKYYQIAKKIGYGKTKTYDLINELDKNLLKIKSAEKNGKK